jgi:hypothetical protein
MNRYFGGLTRMDEERRREAKDDNRAGRLE